MTPLNVSCPTIKIKKRLIGYNYFVLGTCLAAKFEKVPSTNLHPFFWILKTMLKQLLNMTRLNYLEIRLSQTLLFFLGLFPNLSLTHYTAAPTDC